MTHRVLTAVVAAAYILGAAALVFAGFLVHPAAGWLAAALVMLALAGWALQLRATLTSHAPGEHPRIHYTPPHGRMRVGPRNRVEFP